MMRLFTALVTALAIARTSAVLSLAAMVLVAGCSPDDGGPRRDGANGTAPVQVQVDDAYVHPPIADRNVTVGYFEIVNHGAQPLTLIGASSEVARRMEVHTHVRDGDMVRMRPLRELELPTGERVHFEPGGHHLMFMGVESMPERSVDVTLHFADGVSVTVPFQVRGRG